MSLDPDPMRAPGTDDISPSAERARRPLLHATAFRLGFIVGLIAAMALLLAAIRGGA